ncbi:MAG TPA: hypothetical protein VMU57_15555 [Edaphobacter sp.]|nr:hypothetical protein [Edaphobacter sp.]
MVNEKHLFRLALYRTRYALPVPRPKQKDLENEQVERALEEGNAIAGIVLGRHPTQSISLSRVECQQESEEAD